MKCGRLRFAVIHLFRFSYFYFSFRGFHNKTLAFMDPLFLLFSISVLSLLLSSCAVYS